MSQLRWRYAWRNLWMQKTRTFLVILSIAVGVFAFAVISGAGNTLRTELPAKYLEIVPASATLHISPFDTPLVDSIRRMPEVAAASGRTSLRARYLNGDGEWRDIQLFALEDYQAQTINLVLPSQGTWPPSERAILIERNSIGLTGMRADEPIVVETSNGRERTLPIVGLAYDMNQPPAQITGIPYGYVTRDTLEWLGYPRAFNRLHLVVAEQRTDKQHILNVASIAADKAERSGYTVFWKEVPEPGQHFAMEFLPTILLILGILGTLALILSGFLVVNIITAILTQQTRQIGVMKAIGASPDVIARLYLRIVVIFGLAALLLSVPLGMVGALAFSRFVASQLNFDLDRLVFTPGLLALQITAGLIAPVIAAIFPILAAARITVREAIQDTGLDSSVAGQGHLEALFRFIQEKMRVPRPLILSLRNTFRRRGRLVRTLIPLALGGAIFMSVLSVRASLFRTLEDMLVSQGFDLQVQLTRPYQVDRVEQLTAQVEGITAIEGWTVGEGVPVRADGTEGDSLLVHAVPADTRLFAPTLVGGRWLEPNDEDAIVVSTGLLLDEPHLGLGEPLTLRIDGKDTTWRIVGLNERFQPPIAPSTLYVNRPRYWRLLGNSGRADTIRIITDGHDAATHARVAAEIEARFQSAGIEIRSTRTATEDRDIFGERFNIITTVLLMMAFLLATVGGLGLMGTMSINVLERTREIGVMRAIGASDFAVLQIFIAEGLVIGALSWMGALILSQPMSRMMSQVIGMNFARLPLTYVFDLRAPLFWMLIVALISILASIVPARNAAGIPVRETLAYE